ncbi:hypothetical protein [Salinicola halimionae]|uniref:hypothetical protein n=1 Tax=Salinicola halimionae TaxID=1949081 RepID=UPI001CB7472A|nr:hypothetical protein [Salinicola halimionae]
MSRDTVCVFEYGIHHPGLRIKEIGRFPGLHYRINNGGEWERITHEDDCACGSDHVENFCLLGRVEISLKDGWLNYVEPGLYVQQGIERTSDPRATWGEPY